MEPVLRASAIYVVLMVLFRISGRRSLAEMTSFDLLLLLVISETTQQALLGEDFSVTNAILVMSTMLALDIALSLAKLKWNRANKWIEGVPTILVEDGRPLTEVMSRARVREEEILEAARRLRGLERMDEIKYAVLEASGGITIIPKN
jgi:uncharacterized membrane protein YcaP (DUF421 family)